MRTDCLAWIEERREIVTTLSLLSGQCRNVR